MDTNAMLSDKLTFMLYFNIPQLEKIIRSILRENWWKEIKYKDFANSKKANLGLVFIASGFVPKDIAGANCVIKSVLGKTKESIANKRHLHSNMAKFAPEIYNKHMKATWSIDQFQWKPGVYILRPYGRGFYSGIDITMVTSEDELNAAKAKYAEKGTGVIVSEYIENPLLLNGRKFHVRIFLLVVDARDKKYHIYEEGKIMLAKLPYVAADYHNSDIHDTHIESTEDTYVYPDDFPGETGPIWAQICKITDSVMNIYKQHISHYPESKYAFEIFAMDLLVDTNMNVFLLEVNDKTGFDAPIGKDDQRLYNDKYMQYHKKLFTWVYNLAIEPIKGEILEDKSQNTGPVFVLYAESKHFENIIRNFLKNKGWREQSLEDLKSQNKLRNETNRGKTKYDLIFINANVYPKYIYGVNSVISNQLTNDKMMITNKYLLNSNMAKFAPEIYNTHMKATWSIDQFQWKPGVYILRPYGRGFYGGAHIYVVANEDEFTNARNKYRQDNIGEVIVSKYIVNPLLLDGRKFHIRRYLLVSTIKGKLSIMWDKGKIMLAKLPYVAADYQNPDIHDTHMKSSFGNYIYPDDLPKIAQDNLAAIEGQTGKIIDAVMGIYGPHVNGYSESDVSFEILALDLMVDSDLNVVLIEINDKVGYAPAVDREGVYIDDEKYVQFHNSLIQWAYSQVIEPIVGHLNTSDIKAHPGAANNKNKSEAKIGANGESKNNTLNFKNLGSNIIKMNQILEDSKSFELIRDRADPVYKDIITAIDTVKNFIIKHKLIVYGGTAIDFALRLKGGKIYDDATLAAPDLDFYSPNNVEHSYELADQLFKLGYGEVRVIRGTYVRVMKVDLEDNHYIADIAYMPEDVFKKIPTLEFAGMRFVHPFFQRIDLHSSLGFPYDEPPREVIFNRWNKDIKRFNMLDEKYPIEESFVSVGKDTPANDLEETDSPHVGPKYVLWGFAGYAILAAYFAQMVKKYDIAANPLLSEDAAKDFKKGEKDTYSFTYQSQGKFEIVHINPRAAMEKFSKKDDKIIHYEPYVTIIPERYETDSTCVYSVEGKLTSVNIVNINIGENIARFKITNAQLLLKYFIGKANLAEDPSDRNLFLDIYNRIMGMINTFEKHFEKIAETEDVRKILQESPLFPSVYTYGGENTSSAYKIMVNAIDAELDGAAAYIMPWNYYPNRYNPKPKFNPADCEFYRESGKIIGPFSPLGVA